MLPLQQADFQDKGVYLELIYPPLSPKWFEYKRGRVSATGVGSICNRNRFRTKDAYMNSILYNISEPDNENMERGRINEPLAADLYAKETGYQLRVGSLCVNKSCSSLSDRLCATPDRFIVDENGNDTDRIVEIKSPNKFADYIYPNYYLQFLTQMWVTGIHNLDYVQYVNGENYIMEVKWNQKHWDEAFVKINEFITELVSKQNEQYR